MPARPNTAPAATDPSTLSPLLSLILGHTPASPTASATRAANKRNYGNPQGFGVPNSFFTRGSSASPFKWASSGSTRTATSADSSASPGPGPGPGPDSSPANLNTIRNRLRSPSPYDTPNARLA